MSDKQIIIEDCPYFIGGNCQEYLDGVCENHKCDLKIIRELEEKLSNKRKECDELHETVKSQKEEIKNLNYTLYEERNLTTDLAKANLKISTLKRDLSSARNRFKNENQQNKEIIKAKEQECEEFREQLAEMISQSALLPKFFGFTADEITNMLNQLDQLKSENKHLNDLLNQALKDYEKVIQTLTEIKEMCKEEKGWVNCSDMKLTETAQFAQQIFDKISEVEE